MRLIKMFGLAALAAVAAMAFVGATPASATSTQLCNSHTGLTCGSATSSVHLVLAAGTVLQLLAAINVLCLGELEELTPLSLGSPQTLHTLARVSTGCGTGSAHNNCTLTTPQLPLSVLLKTGLDEGVETIVSGQVRLTCSNLGLNCLYDLEGMESVVSGGHVTKEETSVSELGGKFFCPNEGLLDGLLETLTDTYVLG